MGFRHNGMIQKTKVFVRALGFASGFAMIAAHPEQSAVEVRNVHGILQYGKCAMPSRVDNFRVLGV
jgi:hypothetical protein